MLLETQQPVHAQRATTPVSEKVLESQRNLDETAELYRSLRTAASVSNDTKRMERVQEKLKSVTVWGSLTLGNTFSANLEVSFSQDLHE